LIQQRIGFIGSGQMARAVASGFVAAKLVDPGNISFSDPSTKAIEVTQQQVPGSKHCKTNADVLEQSDIVFLAVKPQYVDTVSRQVGDLLADRHLLVSIVAGATVLQLSKLFDTKRIIRVMPNTPSLIGEGAAGIARGAGANDQDIETIVTLMNSVGVALEVSESQIDAVTGMSGSGPAYVFSFIEAMSDGAVKMGLPRDIATSLAVQTVLGSAKLVQQSGKHPAVLRDQVTSPGGTTIAGLHELESGAFHATIMNAIEAATEKAKQLGRI
jgi:pyrroline-5-carboxylate reductase